MERWSDSLIVTVSSKSKRLVEVGNFAVNWVLSMQIYELIKETAAINIAASYFEEFVEFCQASLQLNKSSSELVVYAEGTICENQLGLILSENELSGRLTLRVKTGNEACIVLDEDELLLLSGLSAQATGIIVNGRLASAPRQQAAAPLQPQQQPRPYAPVTQPVTPPPAAPRVTFSPASAFSQCSNSAISPSLSFLSTGPSTPELTPIRCPPPVQGKINLGARIGTL
jgi:hypothetical protein